jgi:sugar phosphate permease
MLVTAMLSFMNWRLTFVVFGSIGFGWAFLWYRWFRDEPSQHSGVGPEELRLIESGRAGTAHHAKDTPWRRILTNRSVLALSGMYLTQTYGFYFYITWLPRYLDKERGFSAANLAIVAGMPMLLSVAADFFGGVATDRLTRRYGAKIGRVVLGAISFLLASLCMFGGAICGNAMLAAILISIAAAWSNFILGAAWGSAVDIGGRHAAVVSACMNTAGQIGGVLSPLILAFLVVRFTNWTAALCVIAALYFLGGLCWLLVDPAHRIEEHS